MVNNELIHPQSILVVGGSNDPLKTGGKLLKNLIDGGFGGKLWVINPKQKQVQGVECFKDIPSAPAVDLAIMAVPAPFCKAYVQALAEEKKAKAIIILSAGFSEMGEEGRKAEEEIASIATGANISLIGPNCIGVLTPTYNGIFAGPIPKLSPKGCDFASGSGSTAAFIIEKGIPMGLSFASLFSVGNSAQITVEDIVEYWDQTYDEKVSSPIKLLYLENIGKPQKLLKHASSLIRKGCKIAAIKAGSSEAGSRAASSHTGAIASSDMAVSSLFKKAGIIRCEGREELLYTASALMFKELKGKNIAIVTQAGGPGVMLTDYLSEQGLSVPELEKGLADELKEKLFPGSSTRNPVDFLATGNAKQLDIILDYLENRFKDIDGIVVVFGSPGFAPVDDVYEILSNRIKNSCLPIYPILPSVVTAAKEIKTFLGYNHIFFTDEVLLGQALANIWNAPLPSAESDLKLQESADSSFKTDADGYLLSEECYALLTKNQIPFVKELLLKEVSEVDKVEKEIKFPWVMKVVGPLHKSDVGGVELNIETKEEAKETFHKLMGIAGAQEVLVQPMQKGTEFFVGVKKEEPYGHMILCGMGGIYIEILKDYAVGLAPLGDQECSALLKELKSYPLFQGYRGQPALSETDFKKLLQGLSDLILKYPQIRELDLNPVMVTAEGVSVVDSRIRV